jgi:hypothetical protein
MINLSYLQIESISTHVKRKRISSSCHCDCTRIRVVHILLFVSVWSVISEIFSLDINSVTDDMTRFVFQIRRTLYAITSMLKILCLIFDLLFCFH